MVPHDRMWSRTSAHWYFVSFSFIALTALIVLAVLVPVALLWPKLWPLLIFGPVIVPCTILARGTELTVSSHGIELHGHQYRWDALELVHSDLGEVLRTKRSYLEGHAKIYLRMYAHDWRTGAIGDDLRTWAPHLLVEDDSPEVDADTEAA